MERKPVVIAQEALEKEAAVCEQIKALWASRGRTPRAFVDTYGCQQNEADSERIRGMLRASGYEIVDTEEGADCIVINTCAIREHAETRVYGNVGALVHTKARHPEQKIFLCGCMMGQPQVVERIKNSYRHVDGVFNPHELWRFPELLQSVLRTNKRIFAVDDSAGNIAEGIPVVRSSDLKAWVSIMYGCKYLNFSRSTSEMDLIARRAILKLEGEAGTQHIEEYLDGRTERGKAMRKCICEELHFDSLEYQSLDNLIEAIGLPACKLCTYCWNGKE